MRKWMYVFDFKGVIKCGGVFDKDVKLFFKGFLKWKFCLMLFFVKIVLRW